MGIHQGPLRPGTTSVSYSDFGNTVRREPLVQHQRCSLKRFRDIAKRYGKIWNNGRFVQFRVWVEDMDGNVIYDTARRDHSREAWKVRKARLEELPLLMSRLKTKDGQLELEHRLRSNTL